MHPEQKLLDAEFLVLEFKSWIESEIEDMRFALQEDDYLSAKQNEIRATMLEEVVHHLEELTKPVALAEGGPFVEF